MSRVQQAKDAQGYEDKAIPQTCMNCRHFTSEKKEMQGVFSTWTRESNMRCGIGGFVVKKMATCNRFEKSNNV